MSKRPLRDLGPSPSAFRQAFGVGAEDELIHPVDAVGVALASIQGIHELLSRQAVQIEALRRRLTEAEHNQGHR